MENTNDKSRLDYEALAREAEQVANPTKEIINKEPSAEEVAEWLNKQKQETQQLEPQEVQTTGPVIIDTLTGTIRRADTGEAILERVQESTERTLDLTLVSLALTAVAGLCGILAICLSTFTPSLKFGLIAMTFFLLGERLWWELRRSSSPTAPEGVIHVAQQQV